jgi:hypothetical protein
MNSTQNNIDNIKDLDTIIEEVSYGQLKHIRDRFRKRRLKFPPRIRVYMTDNFYLPNRSFVYYDKNVKAILLNRQAVRESISKIISIYNEKNSNHIKLIFVPQTYQLLSGNHTKKKNIIMIPLNSSPYNDIIKNYVKFLLLPAIWSSMQDTENLELPEKIKEYVIYTLSTLSYYQISSNKSGLINKGIFTTIYNTMECTDVLESATPLINEDPFTPGTCTAYYLLIKNEPTKINLKDIYRKLINDPYYFLKNIQNNTNNTFL